MKRYILDFLRRGLLACGIGPLVLAVFYLILHRQGLVKTLDPEQVCLGIFSLSALAFIAGGMNVVYQIERLPLMAAVSLHGGVLYVSYLITYLINGWLEGGITPFLVFTGIFLVGYVLIWAVIYSIVRKKIAHINEMLNRQRQKPE